MSGIPQEINKIKSNQLVESHDDEIELTLSDEEQYELTIAAKAESEDHIARIANRKSATEIEAENIRNTEPNLVARAKKLLSLGESVINFEEVKWVKEGGMPVSQPVSSDINRVAVFEALFGSGKLRPYFDTFRARIIDPTIDKPIDKTFSMVNLVKALSAAGLRQQTMETARANLREWALLVHRNSLQERFLSKLPEWDKVPRIERALIDIYEPHDTPTTRRVSMYLWLSLYARIMHPGCSADVVVTLIGAQHCGKSYLGKFITQQVVGPDSLPAKLVFNKNGNMEKFLRNITGQAVVAQCGEMAGMDKADLPALKDFLSDRGDTVDFKFENPVQVLRQWIAISDSNKYDLQRDDTGNRRFYPVVCGQTNAEGEAPTWKAAPWKANVEIFERDFWQYMAEAHEWMKENGVEAYNRFADQTSDAVQEFSTVELKRGHGAVPDYAVDTHLMAALQTIEPQYKDSKKQPELSGEFILASALARAVSDRARTNITTKRVQSRMEALGFEFVPEYSHKQAAFVVFGDRPKHGEKGLIEKLIFDDDSEVSDVELSESAKKTVADDDRAAIGF